MGFDHVALTKAWEEALTMGRAAVQIDRKNNITVIDSMSMVFGPYFKQEQAIRKAGRRMNCTKSKATKRKWRKRMEALKAELVQQKAEAKLLKLLEGG